MQRLMPTPYRAENVGSFLRPSELLEARSAHANGKLTLDRLRAAEDRAILGVFDDRAVDSPCAQRQPDDLR